MALKEKLLLRLPPPPPLRPSPIHEVHRYLMMMGAHASAGEEMAHSSPFRLSTCSRLHQKGRASFVIES